MNAAISALVWCVIQVTALTCGVAIVYLVARRLHPRAGAAAAGGGLFMVLALTAMLASPWPRWQFERAVAGDVGDASSSSASAMNSATPGFDDEAGATSNGIRPAKFKFTRQSSYWSTLVKTIRDLPGAGADGANTAAETQAAKRRWPIAALVVFAAGGLFAAARLAWGVASVRRLARSGRALEDSRVIASVREMQHQLELQSEVAVRETDALSTPATVGWRRPVVMLPTTWREWSESELRAALAHELAHIAGRDYAAWFVARTAVVAHFYHPLVRWLASRLQLEQELAADMAAARVLGDTKQYLHSLASLALSMPPQRVAGPARTLCPTRSLLMRRVEMLRSTGAKRRRPSVAHYAAYALVAIVAIAAAGLRGTGVDLARTASAEEPATNAAKNDAATPLKPLGLELVPEGSAFVARVPVAKLIDDPRLKDIIEQVRKFIVHGDTIDKDEAALMDALDELMFVCAGNWNGLKSNERESVHLRYVLRARSAERLENILASWRDGAKPQSIEVEGTKVEVAPKGDAILRKLDERTAVIDVIPKAFENGEWKGPLPPLVNPLPDWHEQWDAAGRDAAIEAILHIKNAKIPNLPPDIQSLSGMLLASLSPVLEHGEWVIADIKFTDKLRLAATVRCDSDKSTKAVGDSLHGISSMLQSIVSQYLAAIEPETAKYEEGAEKEFAQLWLTLGHEAGELLASTEYKAEGDLFRLSMETTKSADDIAKLAASYWPGMERLFAESKKVQSTNNLKNLALAMLNYESSRQVFPSAAGKDYFVGQDRRTSKFPHSWRIELLPWLDQQALYDEYHFDEPWDSAANKKVLAKMPEVFRSPFDDGSSTNTSYFVFTGPQTMFPPDDGEKAAENVVEGAAAGANDRYGPTDDSSESAPPRGKGLHMAQVTDGTSKTWMLVESKKSVPWTKPEDIEYAADKPLPKLGGWEDDAFLVTYVDGSVRPVSPKTDEKTIRACITRNGGENSGPLK